MSVPALQTATERVAHLMASKPEILAAYIFGSVASGHTRATSDVDLAVLLDPEFVKRLPLYTPSKD